MSAARTRFDGFSIHGTSYKRVGNHDIAVYVLVPKDIKPGRYPLVVKFHGGSFVHGDAIYAEWFTGWLVTFIHRNNAIAVLPNYRLMPGTYECDMVHMFLRRSENHIVSFMSLWLTDSLIRVQSIPVKILWKMSTTSGNGSTQI
jgi:hypothetical protein